MTLKEALEALMKKKKDSEIGVADSIETKLIKKGEKEEDEKNTE